MPTYGNFNDDHSGQCKVIPHCSLYLYFSDNCKYCAVFHMPADHLYVIFGELSISIFCPSFNFFLYFWYWAAYFREYFVYYLLSVSLFANIFCQFFVVVLLMTSFAVQKFLSLVKCHLLIFAFISITLGDSSQNILLQYVNRCSAQRKVASPGSHNRTPGTGGVRTWVSDFWFRAWQMDSLPSRPQLPRPIKSVKESSIAISTAWMLPIQEHSLSFYLLVPSLIFFISVP